MNEKNIFKSINNGRYKIIDKIADGGMAEVFEAYDTYTKENVAIKMMSKVLSDNQEAVERFKKNMKLFQTLNMIML